MKTISIFIFLMTGAFASNNFLSTINKSVELEKDANELHKATNLKAIDSILVNAQKLKKSSELVFNLEKKKNMINIDTETER